MITAFDLIRFILAFTLAYMGFFLGRKWGLALGGGNVGGISLGVIAAALGFFIGRWIGNIPWRLAMRSGFRELAGKSTEALLAELREHRTWTPNFVIVELARRGHDISAELPVIFELLASPEHFRRTRGWAALKTAFPDVAGAMRDYWPSRDSEQNRGEIERVRQLIDDYRARMLATAKAEEPGAADPDVQSPGSGRM